MTRLITRMSTEAEASTENDKRKAVHGESE